MKNEAVKSNTWIVLVPVAAWLVTLLLYIRFVQESANGRYDLLMAAGISIPFLATGVAQLRSGYRWRNLASGNRGKHRSDNPKIFMLSTALHLVAGSVIAFYFVSAFVKQGG